MRDKVLVFVACLALAIALATFLYPPTHEFGPKDEIRYDSDSPQDDYSEDIGGIFEKVKSGDLSSKEALPKIRRIVAERAGRGNLSEAYSERIRETIGKTEIGKLSCRDATSLVKGIIATASRHEFPPSEWHSPPEPVLMEGSGVESADYMIFKGDRDNIYAKSGDNGQIMYSGSDADRVIQSCIDALDSGGKISIKAGTYDFDDAIVFDGAADRAISLIGEAGTSYGSKGVEFNQTTAGGNVIEIRDEANSIVLKYLGLVLPESGKTGHGLATEYTGFSGYGTRNSVFKNLRIYNGDENHWGIYLENPYQCTFSQIAVRDGINGIKIVNDDSSLNHGNSHFQRLDIHIDGSSAGKALVIDSVNRDMNLNTFVNVHITASNYSTGSKCIEVDGSRNWFYGLSLEHLDYAVDVIAGSLNTFSSGYFGSIGGESEAAVHVSASGRKTTFRDLEIYPRAQDSGTALHDETTWKGGHTLFTNLRIGNFGIFINGTSATKYSNVVKSYNGYGTESSGTATIASGTTSVTFSHALIGTPDVVNVTPKENIDGKSVWWTANSENIVIYVSSAISADSDFSWRAEM